MAMKVNFSSGMPELLRSTGLERFNLIQLGLKFAFSGSSCTVAAAATATIERRPVPQGGLALSILRNYSDDEIDAQLRHLGLNYTRNTRRHAQELMIINYYEPRHSEAEERRAQENLDTLKQTNF